MFGITPKSLNAVDMILAFVSKSFAVIQAMMFTQSLQGIVAPKGVRIVNRSFARMFSDMRHELISCHPFHYLRVDPTIALQKPENDAFASRPSSPLALAPTTEVGLVNLNLAFQSARFQLGHMVDRFTQMLVDTAHHLIVKAKIVRHTIRRLLLVKAGDDANLLPQTLERFLPLTAGALAFHIASLSFTDTKRTAENTLSPSQKVGRTVENVLLSLSHKGILTPHGYETH